MNNFRSLVLLTCAFIACLSLSTGFAADLDFDEYVQRADAAKKRGDWESVASQIAQAINHPDLPRAGAVRSAVHLDYGRAMGVLCHFDEAEKYLLLAKQIAQQGNVSTFQALVELGALNVQRKKIRGCRRGVFGNDAHGRTRIAHQDVAAASGRCA